MQARKAGLYENDDPFYQSPPVQTTPDLWTMTVRVEPGVNRRDRGVLTAAEHEAQKRRLLGQ
jgi:hypothetical protein